MSGRPWLLRQAGPPARVILWWVLRARGRDVTGAVVKRSCLVLAAHPDDETLGCSVTIMRKRDAGTPVVLVIATDGSRSSPLSSSVSPAELATIREAEAAEAGRVMGLSREQIVHLGFEDTSLADESEALSQRLVTMIRTLRPDDLLVTAVTDPHPDHAALGSAARRAVAESGLVGIRILEYPIWQWRSPGSWLGGAAALPGWGKVRALIDLRPELVSTAGYLDRKRAALAAHASQTGKVPGDPGWWSLDRRFLVNFFRSHEVYLPVADHRS